MTHFFSGPSAGPLALASYYLLRDDMSVVMVLVSSIGAIDVYLFQLCHFSLGCANLEYVGLVPVGAVAVG